MYSKLDLVRENLDWIKEKEKELMPLREVARHLHVKYDTLVRNLKKLGVEYRKNPNRKGLKHKEARLPLEKILEGNCSNATKRKRLIEEGVKEEKCECCGLSEWMGKPIPLELHHKDFNHYNNNLDNLQILCPNCHMQAHNYNNNYGKQ